MHRSAQAMVPAPSRVWRWGRWALVATLLALYLPTLARGITFSDGGEITTAIVKLGVMHPTGYPLFTLIAHGWVRLFAVPLQDCIKVEVLNSLFAIGAALFTAASVRRLAFGMDTYLWWKRRHGPVGRTISGSAAEAAGLIAGLTLGTAPLLWRQVRIPEVYAFHVLLVGVG